jgi:hypothetical protein
MNICVSSLKIFNTVTANGYYKKVLDKFTPQCAAVAEYLKSIDFGRPAVMFAPLDMVLELTNVVKNLMILPYSGLLVDRVLTIDVEKFQDDDTVHRFVLLLVEKMEDFGSIPAHKKKKKQYAQN